LPCSGEGVVTGIDWGGARGAAKCPANHRTPPQCQTNNYPAHMSAVR